MTRTKIGEAEVSNGVAETTWNVPSNETVGTRTLYAVYQQNDEYMLSEAYNSAVIKIPTTTTVRNASGGTVILGSVDEQVTIYADVKYNTNSNVDAGGVRFVIGSGNNARPINATAVSVSNGVASVNYTITANDTTGEEIYAYYDGAGNYGDSSSSTPATFKVRENSNVVVTNLSANRGTNATIQATITDSNGENIDEGEAQLYIDNSAVGNAVSVSDGEVSFTYAVGNNEVVGAHTIKVAFAQTGNYNASEGTGTLTVRNPTTLTAVDVSANRGQQNVPLIIQVKDSLNQNVTSGTVQITVGSGSAQTATVSAGEAQITYDIPNDAVYGSTISFTATFVEDSTYQQGTTATAGVITIRKPVTLVVDDIDAELGDAVTLSASVTESDGTEITSGTVEFEID